ncbi:ABC transporter ATP-binding protein [Haloplanus rubicundus]|uniref:ABC transporter ATP-binding protein n=1 Tax=Haloplanus rubicundus TaxID=1547898 RepID=A0A345EAI5_9EURY|nr:ABC transporter ATP-binding protein [Haloplanus rubicundus]AXG05856.1 ABC transporter ATP-binding protein [Haloplanus rubicundus]AXG09207.1 ABC transporter ATP-binding protein [Haloplanus rubicundus]
MALLEVEDLDVRFYTEGGVVHAVDGLSYTLDRGERLGVVGESGAGKTVAALAILDLLDDPGRIEGGSIRVDGEEVLGADPERLRRLRGGEVGMVFQDPETALDPVYTVGEQVAEAVRVHTDLDGAAADDRAVSLLDRVGIPDPATRATQYPHEFSGGMAQRAVVAIALAGDPDLLIADEPTTALDVTIQAQLLDLLDELAADDLAVQLISHDLGVVAEFCDRALVMYAGQAVESASVDDLFYRPQHPYTAGLLSAVPRIGDDRDRLRTIPGSTPDLAAPPPGCRFHPRCPYAEDACTKRDPPLVAVDGDDHRAACLAHVDDADFDGDLDFYVEVDGEADP